MKILITAIGSMSADAAIDSFRKLGDVTLVGCDINPKEWLPNSASVDFFYKAPNFFEEDYLPFILDVCKRHKIDMVVPLTDPEVDILSERLQDFEKNNMKICISNPDAIKICRDKLRLFKYFSDSETVNTIPTWTIEELKTGKISFPCIAKPRNGRSSEGIMYLNSLKPLELMREEWPKYIFQPILKGEVFTVDFLRSRTGKTVSIARKELKRTRTGAGLTVETLGNPAVSSIVNYIGEKLNLLGCINMEFIFDGKDFFLMDINPRFSAGVAFSKMTGYDMCMNHIYAFQGNDIDDFDGEPAYGIYAKQYHEVKL